ncbi:substrate binding domain-containing protein [Sinorhizobium psoraleae]|uniref:Substrate binding domain-containing protein n=1 Tax=Sinorhizobium psoraleae TaxID=520838 RepID=A0ABT4KSK6_9HYPH|nr:substrate binding domain-containing protein [Sinorhizobium psoraleae]MCZ4093882.1 substrate binding domain-containing protein [Sinorhizobium psoraleae]
MRSTSTTPRGKVRVTAPLTFGTLRLAPILAEFAKAYPEVSLEVQFTDRMVSLVDEGFDLAVRVGRPRDSTLVARKLIEAGTMTVASPEYLAARGTPEVPQDLVHHDCILDTNFRDPHCWPFAGGLEVPVSGRLTYSDASVCLVAAEAGLGIACLPDFMAAASLNEGRVVQVLSDHVDSPSAVYAMTPSGRHPAAKVRVLIETLAQGLRRA